MRRLHSRRECLAALGSSALLSGGVDGALLQKTSAGPQSVAADRACAKDFDPWAVQPGRKEFGYLTVVSSVAARVEMPVGVINGATSGPTLAVTGGLFPTEYDGVEGAARLYQLIEPGDLKGRVVVIPVVNMPCLQFRTPWLNLSQSVSPMDGLSINSVFPGNPDGSVTRVVAHTLFQQIILKSNYHIDLRGGDLNESHLVHTIFPKIGKEVDTTCEQLAKVVGYEYVLPGTPEIAHTGKGTLVFETVMRGIPSIITESGLGYRTQPLERFVQGQVTGVLNVLRYLGLAKGQVVKPRNQRFLDMQWQRVRAPIAGFFHAVADQGDLVDDNQVLGRITDVDGTELGKIRSPVTGVVHTMFPRRLVYTGDSLYTLLRIGAVTGW